MKTTWIGKNTVVLPGGGVSGAFINARDLARIICKRNKVKFMNKTER